MNEPSTVQVGADADTIEQTGAARSRLIPRAAVGSEVSRYRIREELGEGGMGRVLLAFDPKLRREVAVKEVRPDRLDPQSTARLVAEARAMARLSHPNVVAVYDVESLDDGRVILVMEYVPGTTLSKWQRETERDWRTLVRTYRAAAEGLVAAHEAGLLHRDFKPANVLIGQGPRAVKVTDFGLAKGVTDDALRATAESLHDDDTGATRTGTIMGTPRYMAPEQHAGESLDAAADQYAFCVALWEALAGEPPFRGDDLDTQKREGPPAALEREDGMTVPEPIVEALRRGMHPDPGQRWPTMRELQRALAYDPRRTRTRWLAGLAGLGAISLIASSWLAAAEPPPCSGAKEALGDAWSSARRREVREAITAVDGPHVAGVWTRTSTALDDYAADWTAMYTEACEATNVREEQPPEVMDLRMACLRRALHTLAATSEVLRKADADVVTSAHELVDGLSPLERCADVEALRSDIEPAPPEERAAVERAQVLIENADAELRAGRFEAARAPMTEAAEVVATLSYVPVRIDFKLTEGIMYSRLGRYPEAEVSLVEAHGLAKANGQLDLMQQTASQLLAVVGYRLDRPDEALRRYRATARTLLPDDDLAQAGALSSIALVLDEQGKIIEAEAAIRDALQRYERALGPDATEVADTLSHLATNLNQQTRSDEGVPMLRRALEIQRAKLSEDHPRVGVARNNLAMALRILGDYEAAETEARAAIEILDRAMGSEHPVATGARSGLAKILMVQGKYEQAEEELKRTLELRQERLGPNGSLVATTLDDLGMLYFRTHRIPDAVTVLRRSLQIKSDRYGPEHLDVALTATNLASAVHFIDESKEQTESIALYQRAIRIFEKEFGPDNDDVAVARHNLAEVLKWCERFEEAEAQYRRALEIREKVFAPDHVSVGETANAFSFFLLQQERYDEALPLAERAWTIRQFAPLPEAMKAASAFNFAMALYATGGDQAKIDRLTQVALEGFAPAGFEEDLAEVQAFAKLRRGDDVSSVIADD